MEDLVHDDRASINEQVKDRISNLPDEIIHRILSFLDMKYAIQTSKLSKKWKYIWTSMPCLNLNGEMFRTIPDFARFVKHALSNRNDQKEVSAVELTFRGFFSQFVVKRIVNYAYSHNVRQLKIVQFMCRSEKRFDSVDHNVFSQYPCSSHTLKHLTLATKEQSYYRGYIPKPAWDFPALETLTLSNMQFGKSGDKSLDLFSKCVNLKDLTLHRFSMSDLDIFNICIPKLSNLTITDPDSFPKVFNVVAPQLENLTATIYHNKHMYDSKSFKFLQLSTEGLDSLENVNLSLPWSWYHFKEERYAPRLLDLFQKLHSAKFLIFNPVIIEALSSCVDQLSHEPCPFNNLKCLKIDQPKNYTTVPPEVRNYFLDSSPSATFIMDLPQVPQKRSWNDVDKGTMAKKLASSKEEKQQSKTMIEEYRSGSRQEPPSSFPDQLSHEPSSFNNLKCLDQADHIPRIPAEVRNHLIESSPSATSIMGLSRVPQKRSREEVCEATMAKKVSNVIKAQQKKSREEVDKSTMVEKALFPCTDQPLHEPSPLNNLECLYQTDCIPRIPIEVNNELLESPPSASFNMDLLQVPLNRSGQEAVNGTRANMLDKEKQQTKTMDEENRMLKTKIVMQDELIAEKKAKLEAMKVQNEKRMLEANILMQNKIIAHQKLEEKMQMQEKVIAEQKVMLETMRLQNEMKMFEAKILSQDKIISEQNAMLEAMKLQQENIEKQLGNIDS